MSHTFVIEYVQTKGSEIRVFVTNANSKSDAIKHMSNRLGVKPVWVDVVDSPDYDKLLDSELGKAEACIGKAEAASYPKYMILEARFHTDNARMCLKASAK